MRLRLNATAAFVVLLTAAVAAQALPGITADEVRLTDSTADTSYGSLLHARGYGPQASMDAFELAAAHLEVWAYEDEGLEAVRDPVTGGGGHLVTTVRAIGHAPPSQADHRDAKATLEDYSPAFVANIYSEESLNFSVFAQSTRVASIAEPVLRRDGISADDTTTARQDGASFSVVRLEGDHLLAQADPGTTTVTVKGDFVLELNGVDLRIGQTVYRSQDSTENYTGNAQVDDQAHSRTERLLRVYVTAGTLKMALGPDQVPVLWTQQELSAQTSSTVELTRPRGVYEDQELSGSRALLQGPLALHLAVEGPHVSLEPRPDQDPAATTVGSVPAGIGLIVLFGFLTLVSLTLTIVLAVRAWRAVPSMDEVEVALEGRSYRRAARLAGKIVRTRPQMQDAMLSRAIALSRMGQHHRLIREVREHIASRPPADGTLHYVLGLAYKDLGDETAARRLLAEAAQRTPDLEHQVARHMDMPRPVSQPGGTAYA